MFVTTSTPLLFDLTDASQHTAAWWKMMLAPLLSCEHSRLRIIRLPQPKISAGSSYIANFVRFVLATHHYLGSSHSHNQRAGRS